MSDQYQQDDALSFVKELKGLRTTQETKSKARAIDVTVTADAGDTASSNNRTIAATTQQCIEIGEKITDPDIRSKFQATTIAVDEKLRMANATWYENVAKTGI